MDIPDLVQGALGGEEIQAGVSLGDEDAVCLTPNRTLVYRGEGLLSDEQIEEYSHDVEQITVSEGRRKTKFVLEHIDGTESFTVPANRGEKVLELFLEGVLRLEGVIEPKESLVGVYRFSELTVIVAEGRLVKHIGEQVWNEDYEVYPFEDVTGLEFERASVATSVTLSIDGRPQRIKVPNDTAPVVRQTLEKALFAYYDVGSLDELNRVVDDRSGADAESVDAADDGTDDFEFGDDFDPLVSDDEEELTESVHADGSLAADPDGGANAEPRAEDSQSEASVTDGNRGPATDSDRSVDAATDSGAAVDASGGRETVETTEANAGPGETTRDASGVADSTDAGRGDAGPETGRDDATRREESSDRGRTPESVDGAQAARDAVDGTKAARDAPDGRAASAAENAVTREEFEAVAERLDELTEAVDRQNELLKRQHRAIKQLVKRQRSE